MMQQAVADDQIRRSPRMGQWQQGLFVAEMHPRQAGDTATDWNFYSKRALLAGVYSSTVLFWLNDKSEDFRDTWAFLDRRIADVMKVPKLKGRLSAVLGYPVRRAKAFRNYGVRANS